MKNIILLMLLSLSVQAQVLITVDTANKKQKITGLGTCTGAAELNDHIYELGSSAIRLSLPLGENGLETSANDNTNAYNLDISKFTWSSTVKTIAAEAKKNNVKILVNSFSPPAWMKTHNDVNMGGALRENMYEEFGEWVLGCVKSFQQQTGYYIYSFSPQNEPEFPETYASCIFTPDQLMRASKVIGKRFAAEGISTRIFHGEALFAQGNVLNFCKAVNNNDSCKNYVNAFAIHISDMDGLYPGGGTAGMYKLVWEECQRVNPKKEFWLTEDSNMDGFKNTPLDQAAMLEACYFYNGMKYGNLSMWMYCAKNTRDAMQVYYLFKQIFRFIRPNAVRLETTSADKEILPLVFRHDSLKSNTILLINKGTLDRTVNIDFPGAAGTYDIYRTSRTELCKYLGTSGLLNLQLPAKSITTLVRVAGNKIPTIDRTDTIVVIKNSSGDINLTGISDGGEGNQNVTFTVSAQNMAYLSHLAVNYTSPNTTAKLSYATQTDMTGQTMVYLSEDDHSTAFEKMYSQNQQIINLIIIPYINKAPTCDSIADYTYGCELLNKEQTISLSGITDGNEGKQKVNVTVASSDPAIVTTSAMGYQLKLTPKKGGTAIITVTIKDNGDTYMESVSHKRGVNTLIRTFKVNISCEGLNEEKETSSVYPNPVKEDIYISNTYLEYSSCTISDLTGKAIQESPLREEITKVSMVDLPAGAYIVTLTGKGTVKNYKVIKTE